MTAKITALIERQDNFEIVRDKIAEIIAEESLGQQALALAANKNPDDFKLRVFTERSNPWEEYLGDPKDTRFDPTPLVNIQWDKSEDDAKSSNTVERQKVSATYHIDCYGVGIGAAADGGQLPGDESAALEAQRAARLVRSILMAGAYTYLGMRGVVWGRWRTGAQSFLPPRDERPTNHVRAVRVILRVDFNEFSPQIEGTPLALITVRIVRGLTGEVTLFEGSYPQELTP